MSARIFTTSLFRTAARPRALCLARPSRRTLFGLGPKPQPPANATGTSTGTPPLDEAELARTTEWAQNLFKDKPEAVQAIIDVAKVMEESGLCAPSGALDFR
jgi:hypothetical protein